MPFLMSRPDWKMYTGAISGGRDNGSGAYPYWWRSLMPRQNILPQSVQQLAMGFGTGAAVMGTCISVGVTHLNVHE